MTLKDSCNDLRSKTDYVLDPKLPILVMVDGRSFSKLIKKKFKLPFDQEFIRIMNETAEYCASKIQGCKFAYTQSDEISFLIDQRDSPDAEPFFGGRLCKIQSIVASMASGKFMQLLMSLRIKDLQDPQEIKDFIETFKLPEFDCKAWNVPDSNKVYAWFLFRQQDCLRNSKQQSAQTYLPDRIGFSRINLQMNKSKSLRLIKVLIGMITVILKNMVDFYGRRLLILPIHKENHIQGLSGLFMRHTYCLQIVKNFMINQDMSTNFKNHDRNLKDTRGFRNSKKWKSNFKDLDSSPLRLPMRKHGRQIWCYRDTKPSSWIVSKWLKSKIGKNIDQIYSDYLQKVDPGMSEIKDTFWDLIEDSKESIKLGRSGFYKNPDNTLGYHKNLVPYRIPDRSDEYWNLKNGPGHKSYQRLSRGSESGPVFFGKLKINHELKDVFLISKTIWHDANLPDKTYLEFPDKFYQGLLHDYKTALVPGYHRGLIKKDDSKWSTSGIAEECDYLFLEKR